MPFSVPQARVVVYWCAVLALILRSNVTSKHHLAADTGMH
jgi:hypothetical protein